MLLASAFSEKAFFMLLSNTLVLLSDISVDEIQSRLQKLCASEPSVTMEELEYRLAKLKGARPPAIRVHSIRVSDIFSFFFNNSS